MFKSKTKKIPEPQKISLSKQQIDVKMLQLKEYANLYKSRKQSEAMNKEKVLVQQIKSPTRFKQDEMLKLQMIVKDMYIIEAYDQLVGYCDVIKEKSQQISNSQGLPNSIADILPFITSLCYLTEHLPEFKCLQEVKQAFNDFFGQDITGPPFNCGIDPQLLQMFQASANNQKLSQYTIDLCMKFQISPEDFNKAGHNFYFPQNQQMNNQQYNNQQQEFNYNQVPQQHNNQTYQNEQLQLQQQLQWQQQQQMQQQYQQQQQFNNQPQINNGYPMFQQSQSPNHNTQQQPNSQTQQPQWQNNNPINFNQNYDNQENGKVQNQQDQNKLNAQNYERLFDSIKNTGFIPLVQNNSIQKQAPQGVIIIAQEDKSMAIKPDLKIHQVIQNDHQNINHDLRSLAILAQYTNDVKQGQLVPDKRNIIYPQLDKLMMTI